MRSGKASCALETVWEDKHKYEEAEQHFHKQGATQATTSTQQLLVEVPTVNGPGQEDTEDAVEAEAPDTGSRNDPRKSLEGKKALQKKRKRSPRGWLGQADLAFVGLSADSVWLEKPLFDWAESSYRQRLADSAAQATQLPTLAPQGPCTHGSLVACHHVTWGIWVNKSSFDQAERAFVEWSQALLLAAQGSHRQGTPDTSPRAAGFNLALACPPSTPANGQPTLGSLQALVREVWLEKPQYDAAERGFYESLFDGHPPGKVRLQELASQAEGTRRGRRDRRARNTTIGSKRAGPHRVEREAPSALPYWYFLHKDAEAPWLSKPTYDRAECHHHTTEALRMALYLEAASLVHRPGPRSGLSMSSLRPKKMATNFLVHEKIWFDKFKYDDAERKFYEQMNGPVSGASCQENGASVILRDIARARENIQKSLAGLKEVLPDPSEALSQATPGTSSGPGASSGPGGDHSDLVVRIASLEVENQNLRSVVQDLQQAISRLEARLSTLEKSSPIIHRATAPQTQHVSPMRQVEPPTKKVATPAEDDEDNDIDLFGSDEEEDKEAARLREERLKQYAEKKAKKPSLVAKSSILLDVKPWDDETDMAKLEACVRSVQLDGLLWGGSKLVPVGYGIRKLQIQCVVEDDKVGTDLLEEEITKFEEHVQSVDIAAFNKI